MEAFFFLLSVHTTLTPSHPPVFESMSHEKPTIGGLNNSTAVGSELDERSVERLLANMWRHPAAMGISHLLYDAHLGFTSGS